MHGKDQSSNNQKGNRMTATPEYTHGDTEWFLRDRFGMFIHWGLYALPARHEWIRNREKISIADYQKYFDHFDPDLYDPAEWAKMARKAGMKYVVLTAKHHEGFCLWDTKYTDYKSTNTSCGKDLLKPYVEALRAEGLRVGFYYSLIDWHHPDFTIDRIHPMRENAEERAKNANRDMRRYAQYMRDQVTELLTNYGKIDVLWFDFSYPGEDGKGHQDWESEKLLATVRKLQPHVLLDERLDLPGKYYDFKSPEQYQPRHGMTDDEGNPVTWEACQTFSGSWGYYRDELTWKDTGLLLRMLIDGVSKGGNLLLNVGPTARGEFDARARERLDGLGTWMKYNSRSIYGCGAAPDGITAPADCRFTYNPKTNRLYLHLFAWPFGSVILPEMADKVAYAQFLHDGSETILRSTLGNPDHSNLQNKIGGGDLEIKLPTVKPAVEIPVIEIFLK